MAPSGEARKPARGSWASSSLAAERDKAEPLAQETGLAAEPGRRRRPQERAWGGHRSVQPVRSLQRGGRAFHAACAAAHAAQTQAHGPAWPAASTRAFRGANVFLACGSSPGCAAQANVAQLLKVPENSRTTGKEVEF